MKVTTPRRRILSVVYAGLLSVYASLLLVVLFGLELGHVIGGLMAITRFYIHEKPQQYEIARRTLELRKRLSTDKANFIEERLRVEIVLETDVLKFMGMPDRTSEDFAEVEPGAEDKIVKADRLITWRIGEREVWGVFVRDGVVIATYRPGKAPPPRAAQTSPTSAGSAAKDIEPTAKGRKTPSVVPP